MSDLDDKPGYVLIPEVPQTSGSVGNGLDINSIPLIPDEQGRIQVVAFDFDGTCIKGNSPVLLVRYLGKRGLLKKSVMARLILWGGAYKARLPQKGLWARGAVFSAFDHKPVDEVNRFLAFFYHQVIAERFRGDAAAAMREHTLEGHAVVLVSASFEPIIKEAMIGHFVRYQISTRMAVDNQGCYTTHVDGIPCSGSNKVELLTEFCNKTFGEGKWELSWAYGDHHSDRYLLESAQHPCAVTPDRPLARIAKRNGWPILEWGSKPKK